MKNKIIYALLCIVAYPVLWITKAYLKAALWCWDEDARKESTNYEHQKIIWECRRFIKEVTQTLKTSKP